MLMSLKSLDTSYENLVFKGGGVKSYAYIGSIHVLEEKGVLDGVNKVGGSSAGALYAALVGLNFSADEIENFILSLDPNEELKKSSSEEVNKRFFTEYGNYKGDYINNNFNNFIVKKLGKSDITFQQIHDQRESFGFKDIYLTGVDVSNGKLVVFSYENTPDMKLSDAVRISGGYPLMYTPVQLSDGFYYVDGGLINNYPIDIFNSKYENRNHIANPKTLGLYLGSHSANEGDLGINEISSLINNISDKFSGASQDDVNYYIDQLDFNKINYGLDQPINDIVSYIAHLFAVYSKVKYDRYEGLHEIVIDDEGFNAINLDISQGDVQKLIENGSNAATDYFSTHSQNTDFVF